MESLTMNSLRVKGRAINTGVGSIPGNCDDVADVMSSAATTTGTCSSEGMKRSLKCFSHK